MIIVENRCVQFVDSVYTVINMKCAICGKKNRMEWLYYGRWICSDCWRKEKRTEGIKRIKRIKEDYEIAEEDI